jgi:hypothetical protein
VILSAVDVLRAAYDRRLFLALRDGVGVLASRAASERIRRRVARTRLRLGLSEREVVPGVSPRRRPGPTLIRSAL